VTSASARVSRAEHCSDLLPAYVNGTLGPVERRLVWGHVHECAACRVQLDAWLAISEATKAALPPRTGPDTDAREVVRAALARVAPTPSQQGVERDALQAASPRQRLPSSRLDRLIKASGSLCRVALAWLAAAVVAVTGAVGTDAAEPDLAGNQIPIERTK
jgi:anti-sigma factor RsiW